MSEDNKPFALLTLNSRKIYGSPPYDPDLFFPPTNIVNTEFGTISVGKSVVLFKNLNFREIVGPDLYSKYSHFSLQLTQFSAIPLTGSSASSTYGSAFISQLSQWSMRRNYALYAKGLDWRNSSYSVSDNASTNYAMVSCLTNYKNVTTAGVWNNNDNGYVDNHLNYTNRCIFRKPNQMFDLQLSFAPEYSGRQELSADSTYITGTANKLVWDFIIQFRIVPIS